MIVVHPSTAGAARAEVRVRRALVSVHDKRGLLVLARHLDGLGIEIVATGGTASLLVEAGLRVVAVEELTGFPELLEGRVKSLHPAVHAGILFQRHVDTHRAEVEARGIRPIDLVIVSLYPFAEARARGAELAELVEHIDIGGPALARAAAKNFAHVGVVIGPHQYERVAAELGGGGGTLLGATRHRLAREAFQALAAYDAEIAAGLAAAEPPAAGAAAEAGAGAGGGRGDTAADPLPAAFHLQLPRRTTLRYGENPHQRAGFYGDETAGGLAAARLHQGKELSYTNLLDLDAALAAVEEFPDGGCVVVKHGGPAGVAVAADVLDAFRLARDTDRLSAFGGVIGFAAPVDARVAAEIAADFYEAVVAPAYAPEALAVFARRPALRVIEVGEVARRLSAGALRFRSVQGGALLQEADRSPGRAGSTALGGEVVTRRQPLPAEREGLDFAVRVAKIARSNAVVVASGRRTLGIGAGQASRIDAVRVAGMKAARAGHDLAGSVLASDAFFPFADSVEAAGRLGVRAIAQPGGSRRDAESIAAADRLEIAMVFTGERHFAH